MCWLVTTRPVYVERAERVAHDLRDMMAEIVGVHELIDDLMVEGVDCGS